MDDFATSRVDLSEELGFVIARLSVGVVLAAGSLCLTGCAVARTGQMTTTANYYAKTASAGGHSASSRQVAYTSQSQAPQRSRGASSGWTRSATANSSSRYQSSAGKTAATRTSSNHAGSHSHAVYGTSGSSGANSGRQPGFFARLFGFGQQQPAGPQVVATQVGKASWYGPDFHGGPTANGETYNMYSMTAAHKSLPFNTRVRVTNLDNGRQCVVRVNNRGPFVAGRVIDLSKSAAREIGIVTRGIANVRLDVLGR